MARDWEDEWWEDDCCMNCGESHFSHSTVPGLCLECASLGGEIDDGDSIILDGYDD